MSDPRLPGRLGNNDTTLETDERTDPRIVQALAAAGGLQTVESDATAESSYEECLAFCSAFEEANAAVHPQMLAAMPRFDNVEDSTESIAGVDGNPIALHIHRPTDCAGPLPGIVHMHGGGMVLMTAQDPNAVRWRKSLAASGLVVVGVEFRNGGGVLGTHPFPAGLNDCASAVHWVHANREALGISTLIVSGESGGGNLCIATALKANREGWVDAIDGVYAMCPYISGAYADPPAALPSLRENDDYVIGCKMMGALAKVYDPEGAHSKDPLAWPYHAQTSDLEGLPPHFVSVNELDPLRDEGLAFSRKLLAAGVPTVTHTINGTPHAGDQSFPDVIPDIYQASVRPVGGFARSLEPGVRAKGQMNG